MKRKEELKIKYRIGVIKEELVKFRDSKGKELWGILSLPAKEKNIPLLIICHGFNQTKSQRKFVKLARFSAQNEIAAFRFDFSGHGDSTGELEKISIGKQVEELKAAYGVLIRNKRINKKRIAVLGHSLGALITVLFQTKYEKAKTLILLSPALQQRELTREWHTAEEIKLWEKQGYLDTPKGRIGIQYFKEAMEKDWSDIASRIKIPTLVIHGSEDDDVPIKYFREVMRKLGGKKKLEVVKGADHHFESYQAKNKFVALSLVWLKKYL